MCYLSTGTNGLGCVAAWNRRARGPRLPAACICPQGFLMLQYANDDNTPTQLPDPEPTEDYRLALAQEADRIMEEDDSSG
jgi:hypothetical protein